MEQGIDIWSYVSALLRRTWLILVVFVTGSVLVAGVAYILPPVYEAKATILVETQQIPDRLAESTVTASAAERLSLIEQRLMTRENLLEIIDRLGLFANRPDLTLSQKVQQVRAATKFESFSNNRNPRYRGPTTVSAFNIKYTANSGLLASRVANEFVTIVLDQNIELRSSRASETHQFFEGEVRRIAEELRVLESEIAGYKDEKSDALPESYEFRLTELTGLEERRIERDRRRVELEDQRRVFEEALADGVAPDTVEPPTTPEERELAELRRALVQRSSILRATHPEIVALNARISALENSIAGRPQTLPTDGGATVVDASNLFEREMNARIQVIDRELGFLGQQDEAAELRIEELRASISETPSVEIALNGFQRKMANLQVQYEAAVAKLADAEIGMQLEVNRQAERFEVIEQAIVPERPIAPKRKMIAIAGSAGSLAFGMVLALLLELTNAAVRTSSDLQRKVGLTPVITVPYIRTRGERRRLAFGLLVRISIIGGGFMAVLWAVDTYHLPLEVLFQRLVDKSGIEGVLNIVRARLG